MDIKVQTPAVSAGAQRFTGVANELLNQISVVGNEINNLQGAWQGVAAGQFETLMAQWRQDANNITQLLDEVVTRLNSAATNYEEVESAIQRSFNG